MDTRPPLFPDNKKQGFVYHHRSRIKETSSRRHVSTSPLLAACPKRSALSTERNRLSRPSTPLKDTLLGSRKVGGSNKLQQESLLWPSTMRSLTVAFQSDTLSVPVSKREKPVSQTGDGSLRSSSNRDQRKSETKQSRVIKGTKPAENSKHVNLHRWPTKPSPSPSRQRQSSTSVLSYFADIKKGNISNKAVNHMEDGHHLRLLYNRHLQWQYANARTGVLLLSQQLKAEKLLYSLWCTIMDMWDSVVKKRIDLQQLNLKMRLYSLVNSQLSWLNKWGAIERDHTNSLTWAIKDLQASTIRVPVTGGARGDVETVKIAMCSAVDVLQAMASSFPPIVSRVEETNSQVSQLANLAASGRAILDECESLLSSTAALQVEEQSLTTHLLQMNQTYDHHSAGSKILRELLHLQC